MEPAQGGPGKRTLVEQVYRKAATPDGRQDQPGAGTEAVAAAQASSGGLVDAGVRQKVEAATGSDLSGARVHTGPESAAAAGAVSARAFTVGQDIHFAAGAYQPGGGEGDRLVAHELVHAAQQGSSGGSQPQYKLEVSQPHDAAEVEADRIADGIVDGHGGASPVAQGARGLEPVAPGTLHRVVDQHAGATPPTAAQQHDIRNELFPATAAPPGVAPPVWDGAAVGGVISPAAHGARMVLQGELLLAVNTHLNNVLPGINALAARRALPMTSFEGAGRAAKQVADARFGGLGSAAALTTPQRHQRTTHSFQAGGATPNLHDASARAPDARDLAGWIAESDAVAQAKQRAHHFNPAPGSDEETFLNTMVLTPFVTARTADLELYDRFGFATANPRTGHINILPQVAGGFSDASVGGRPSDAERAAKWSIWQTLVHEYIHTLEHPAMQEMPGRNRTISEGFCEMFTEEVLNAVLPGAAANVSLRTTIEGANNGAPSAAIVGGPPYTVAADYADYVVHAKHIRDTTLGGPGGDHAVKAAFFQGHVEYLGFNPDGTASTPVAAGDANLVAMPPGVTNLTQLVRASGVPAPQITAANPGVSLTPVLPPRVHVPDCREHVVVEASDAAGNSDRETTGQIAQQNGITVGRLRTANPGVTFTALVQGQRLLIPKH
jgi:hypothetical protein